MYGETRKLLRAHVCSHIKPLFPLGVVHATRFIDARDDKPYASVFIDAVDVEYDGLQAINTGTLVITLNLPWASYSDDDLDDVATPIETTLADGGKIDLGDYIAGMVPSGVSYLEPDESPYIGIALSYSFQF